MYLRAENEIREIENIHGGDSDIKQKEKKKECCELHENCLRKSTRISYFPAEEKRGRKQKSKSSNINTNNSYNIGKGHYSLGELKVKEREVPL